MKTRQESIGMWKRALVVIGCVLMLACGGGGGPEPEDAENAAGSVSGDEAAEPVVPGRLQAVDRARDVSRAAAERAARMDSLQR